MKINLNLDEKVFWDMIVKTAEDRRFRSAEHMAFYREVCRWQGIIRHNREIDREQ